MFITLVNAVIWCALTLWLFPEGIWYMVGFWLILLVILAIRGTGFWEVASPNNSDSHNINVNIDGKNYSGTVHRNDK